MRVGGSASVRRLLRPATSSTHVLVLAGIGALLLLAGLQLRLADDGITPSTAARGQLPAATTPTTSVIERPDLVTVMDTPLPVAVAEAETPTLPPSPKTAPAKKFTSTQSIPPSSPQPATVFAANLLRDVSESATPGNSRRRPRRLLRTMNDFFAARLDPSSTVTLPYQWTAFGLMCNNFQQIAGAIDFASTFPVVAPPKDMHVPGPEVAAHERQGQWREFRVFILFDMQMSEAVRRSIDVDRLVRGAASLSRIALHSLGTRDFALHDVEIGFNWTEGGFARLQRERYRYAELNPRRLQYMERTTFSYALTLCVRPAASLRAQADAVIEGFERDYPGTRLVSIHRRTFEWCTPKFKKYTPFCYRPPETRFGFDYRSFAFFEDDCNVTYGPRLMGELRAAWAGLSELQGAEPLAHNATSGASHHAKTFAFFLASDLHNPRGDATFTEDSGIKIVTIPHQENYEHHLRPVRDSMLAKGIQVSLKTVVRMHTGLEDMNWDYSMLVDMDAQVHAAFSVGAPYSSCDRILAMWKSIFARASDGAFAAAAPEGNDDDEMYGRVFLRELMRLIAEDGAHLRTHPALCYEQYERPDQPAAHAELYREFWIEHLLPLFLTKPAAPPEVGLPHRIVIPKKRRTSKVEYDSWPFERASA